jgi:hypothetical protein
MIALALALLAVACYAHPDDLPPPSGVNLVSFVDPYVDGFPVVWIGWRDGGGVRTRAIDQPVHEIHFETPLWWVRDGYCTPWACDPLYPGWPPPTPHLRIRLPRAPE